MEKILILDFGGQYTQLIAKRIRELNVYSEIVDYDIDIEKIKKINPKGIVLSGGYDSVYLNQAIKPTPELWKLDIPILGICYGFQVMSEMNGGKVENNKESEEYGMTPIKLNDCGLFKGIKQDNTCWMSHADSVVKLPNDFEIIASTNKCKVAAAQSTKKPYFGVQFHLEVTQTEFGKDILKNFLLDVCKVNQDWKSTNYIHDEIEYIKNKVKDDLVLCAISGGVDSLVAAMLAHNAIGDNLYCVFVDHGLLRKNEVLEVSKMLNTLIGKNIIVEDASEVFLKELKNVKDPEEKRKIIGKTFIDTFVKVTKRLNKNFKYLLQGTIYPDIVESGTKLSKTIKSHHNVGGLPKELGFELLEPLKYLFKDEVRQIGLKLGIPKEHIFRQPFPGPGLAVRILGEITKEKIKILQEADAIFREKVSEWFKDAKDIPWQYFAVLTNSKAIGVIGDNRAYGYTIALRAVNTEDAMSAQWHRFSYDFLENVSTTITNKVSGVTRIVYDITNKPPGTIEWE